MYTLSQSTHHLPNNAPSFAKQPSSSPSFSLAMVTVHSAFSRPPSSWGLKWALWFEDSPSVLMSLSTSWNESADSPILLPRISMVIWCLSTPGPNSSWPFWGTKSMDWTAVRPSVLYSQVTAPFVPFRRSTSMPNLCLWFNLDPVCSVSLLKAMTPYSLSISLPCSSSMPLPLSRYGHLVWSTVCGSSATASFHCWAVLRLPASNSRGLMRWSCDARTCGCL
mmetsp:Transcript_78284/g.219016  ORF Transcript_78284/g.219016 Transcript_78284/m.219016 type:complete len:222 (+) Transcript_78284:166-831(+)